jgi:HD-GYP domain-containing protein (c-di-GMP phosphodiesterase class II)
MIQTLDIICTDGDMPASVQFEMRHLEDKYRDQILTMACTLVSLVDLRDSYTGGHSTRVADYVRPIALQMQLTDREIETVIMAASLHDIGKIGVPEHILRKPGKLTEEEFEYIRKHPEFGWMVLRGVDGFEEVGEMMLHHHERLDGRGYPGGLTQLPRLFRQFQGKSAELIDFDGTVSAHYE